MDITYDHWREHMLLDLDACFFLSQVISSVRLYQFVKYQSVSSSNVCAVLRGLIVRSGRSPSRSPTLWRNSCVQAAIPHLEKTKGSIVNISR